MNEGTPQNAAHTPDRIASTGFGVSHGAETERLLTVTEAAERLQFSVRKVREYARRGHIPVVRLNGRDLRFHWPTVIKRLAGAQ